MRYRAKKSYKEYSKGGTLLWSCESGEMIDVESVGNTSLVKLINRSWTKGNVLFSSIHFNKKDLDEFAREYLEIRGNRDR